MAADSIPARRPRRAGGQRVRELMRGLGGMIALGLIVVGAPTALSRLGWPLPRRVPALDELRAGLLRARLPWSVIVRAMATVLWAAWALFVLAVAVEAYGWIRGVDARRVRMAGPLQSWACQLVAAAVLVLPSMPRLAAAPAAVSMPLGLRTGPRVEMVVRAAPETGLEVVAAQAPSPAPPNTYVVRRHDCLWDIAERYLGDAFRYREIAALSGETVQPDGRRLVDPHWIYPGWILTLPPDAVGLPDRPVDLPSVEGGATRPADGGLPTTTVRPAVPTPTTPTTDAPAAATPTAPSTTARFTGSTAARTATSNARAAHAPGSTAAPGHSPERVGATNRTAIAAGVGAAALLAGVVMWRLDRLRQAQHRRRRRSRDLVRPDPVLEPVERKARAIASADAARWIDLALRYVWYALAEAGGGGVESIVCVRAGDLGMELVVDPPMPPVGRFVADADERTWRLDPEVGLDELATLADGQSPLVPALVTVGTTADGPLLIDLERAGVLAVEGDEACVEAFLAARALELATAPWSTDTPVYLIGGDRRLAALDLVQLVEDPKAFARNPRGVTTLVGDELDDAPSTVAARVSPGNVEAWEPSVVVSAPGATSPDVLASLARRAAPCRSGLAVVAAGPMPAATWRLVIGADGQALLEPLGVVVDARVDPAMIEGMVGLLVPAAEDADIAPVIELKAQEEPVSCGEPVEGEVNVLGPVEVTWAGPVTRPPPERANLLAALVAYLGTHYERPVPVQRLQNALWPFRDDHPRMGEVKDGTLRTTVSRARKALGLDSTGVPHLPEAKGSAYRLGPRFSCDWRRFRRLVGAARVAPSGEAMQLLRQALALVRGRPFEDAPPTFGWAEAEQLTSRMEVAIAEVAEELAERARAAGDPVLSAWAADQGLRALPAREALYRVKMQAAYDAGDPDGVEQAYTEARRAILAIDPLEELQEETIRLHQMLKRATRASTNRR